MVRAGPGPSLERMTETPRTDALRSTSRWDENGWVGNYLYAFSQSIGGGTSEIQRNIVGDRVLGLPR